MIELGSVEQIIYKMGARLLGSIREGAYNHKRLQHEINAANGEIKALKADGVRPVDIARRLGIGRASVYRVLGAEVRAA